MEQSNSAQPKKQYLSIPEIQPEYGGSEGFWRKLVLRREIPYAKFGRSVRIARSAIEAYIRARTVSVNADQPR